MVEPGAEADKSDTRAQIDTETAKALILVNGGAAVAVLAFLPTAMAAGHAALAWWIVWALGLYHGGVFAAVLHNHFADVVL